MALPATHSQLEQEIRELTATQRRAVLRALMPEIDIAIRQGVTYAEISRRLTAAGVTLAPESVRKARMRWRSKSPGSAASHMAAPDTVPFTPPTPKEPAAVRGSGIHSKADLVRLRTSAESIDLTQLGELARQK